MDILDVQPVRPSSQRQAQGNAGESSVTQKKTNEAIATSVSISQDASTFLKDTVDWLLRFLSSATNETITACAVGLGASTYLILGRLGLLFIGFAAGVVLHATYDRDHHLSDRSSLADDARKRKETSLDLVNRVLDWDRARRSETVTLRSGPGAAESSVEQAFSSFEAQTRKALETLSTAIIRDYVHYWYTPVLPLDLSFPTACSNILNSFLLSFGLRVSKKRPADVFLTFLTNSSSIVIVFLNELAVALAGSQRDPQVAISDYLSETPGSSLSNILDEADQARKLELVASDILESFAEKSVIDCDVTRTFLQRVLTTLILETTVVKCSKAAFINEWIIYALEETETSAGNDDLETTDLLNEGASDKQVGTDVENTTASTKAQHRRTVSRAEAAMEQAMQEAKAMNDMIALEEAKKSTQASDTQDKDVNIPPLAQASPTVESTKLQREIEQLQPEIKTQAVDSDKSGAATSFDQIFANQDAEGSNSDFDTVQNLSPATVVIPEFTLHKARVNIFDDAVPGEKDTIRAKPTIEYLLQIEPPTSHYAGWMIARKYSDFETLHEVIRRISVISGVAAFAEKHQTLPPWKSRTKKDLRVDLEHYLQDALSFQRLAESEAMKRFLEREQKPGASPSPTTNKSGFGFPVTAAFENVGKGMLDALTSAPKGAATGGKAFVGGVTGVFGSAIGGKKSGSKKPSSLHGSDLIKGRSSSSIDHERSSISSFDNRSSRHVGLSTPDEPRSSLQVRDAHSHSTSTGYEELSFKGDNQSFHSDSASDSVGSPKEFNEPMKHDWREDDYQELHLPPPPSEISDDYKAEVLASPRVSSKRTDGDVGVSTDRSSIAKPGPAASNKIAANPSPPLSIQESSVAVELFFAIINELYRLSSAWTLRLTLLNTAKTLLLRPGNANLESIRQMLQTTALDANVADASIAAYIYKLRENALPTEEELRAWPEPASVAEEEGRRAKARKLLMEKGMPLALTSVMGAAASSEALGKVFDCLQMERVARGLVFALVLQAMKAVMQ